jgi:3-isopropylmalate/(R)-2-methylmalate dehydratase large subunit
LNVPGLTIAQRIWDQHAIAELAAGVSLLHIDRVFMHEKTGGRMLKGVMDPGRTVAHPELVFGSFDHVIDSDPGRNDPAYGNKTRIPGGPEFIQVYRDYSKRAGIPLIEIADPDQGIVHVIAPELGVALPGTTFVCGDSHTCSLGALGALAWGIGVTEGEHVLATQTLRANRQQQMKVVFDGQLGAGVTAKDMILALIGKYGAAGGSGYIAEFTGAAVRALSIDARLTLCNMAVEFAAWTGVVAPDDTTFEYLHGRRYAPKGALWDKAVAHWRALASDADASYDQTLHVDCSVLEPQVTWGTSPQHVVAVNGVVPEPASFADGGMRGAAEKAIAYSGLQPGTRLDSVPIEAAFIGSCTNSRLSDLRAAAAVLKGRHVAKGVKAICTPGSSQVKRAAEAEGIDRVFKEAGFEWRESACSLCFYANGDSFGDAKRVITSTNRNFENRQGPGVRSHLASPATVAASAIAGHIADPRKVA